MIYFRNFGLKRNYIIKIYEFSNIVRDFSRFFLNIIKIYLSENYKKKMGPLGWLTWQSVVTWKQTKLSKGTTWCPSNSCMAPHLGNVRSM